MGNHAVAGVPVAPPRLSRIVERRLLGKLALPVLAFGVLVGSVLAMHQYQGVVVSNLELTAAMSQYVQRYMDNAVSALNMLSGLARQGGTGSLNVAMQELQQQAPYFERILYVDAQNTVMMASPPEALGLRYPSRAASAQGESHVMSRPTISPDTGNLIVRVDHTVRNLLGEDTEARMVGELSLEGLKASVLALVQRDDTTVLLTDAFGNLIVHPEDRMVQQQTNIGHWRLFQKATRQQDGAFLHQEQGAYQLTVVRQLTGTSWKLLVSQPLLTVLTPVLATAGMFLFGVVLFYIALAAIIRLELGRLVVAPLTAFAASLRRVESDDAAAISPDASLAKQPFAELERLAHAYAHMADTVRQREAELRASEEQYRAIFENAQEGIYQVDAEGALIKGNPAVIKMLGYDSEADARQHLRTVKDVYVDFSRRTAFLKELMKTGVVTGFEVAMRRKDGSAIWVLINARAILGADGMPEIIEGMMTDISARKRMEEALHHSHAFFHAVFEGINDALFVLDAASYRVQDANQQAADMFGTSVEPLKGVTIDTISSGVPPYTSVEGRQWMQRAREEGPQTFEWHSRHIQGTLFWSEVSIRFADIAGEARFIVTVRDISQRKVMEAERHEAEERYRDIFQNAPIAIFRSTMDGRLLTVNPEYAAMLGYESAEALCRTVQDLASELYVRPEDRGRMLAALEAHGQVAFFETQMRRRDGRPFWISINAKLMRDDNGEPMFIEGFHADITERKAIEFEREHAREELERQVTLRTEELQQANTRLVELDRLKTAFLSSASHELRTPLTSILGFAKITAKNFQRHYLAEAASSSTKVRQGQRIHDNLNIIAKEGARLSRLVNDLLDINAIESGAMKWRDTWVDVLDVLQAAASNARGALPLGRVRLQTQLPLALPHLYADRDKLLQVLQNLLNNAMKFTEDGEVTLTAMVVAPILDRPQHISISVQDTGAGIPSASLEAIFDKFYQVMPEGRDEDKPRGTGLGLAICREIVEHYGGRIWAESTLGVGTTLSLELPVLGERGEEETAEGLS